MGWNKVNSNVNCVNNKTDCIQTAEQLSDKQNMCNEADKMGLL